MADVSRVRERAGGADRAQLFLVGALTLAVLFVGLALLLNTAIFTENLATRSTDPGTGQAVDFSGAAERGATGLLYRANHAGGSPTHAQIRSEFESTVGNWSAGAGLHNARDARLSTVTVDTSSYVEGSRIEQTDQNRNFTNASYGATNWKLADDVRTREFVVVVERDELESTTLGDIVTLGDPAFEIQLTNGSGTYSVYVYENGGDVAVGVETPGGTTQSCSEAVGTHGRIDITGRTINGTHCPALELLGDLPTGTTSDPVDVRYVAGNNAVGTYELTVDDSSGVETSNLGSAPGPTSTGAVYDANVSVTYRSTEIYFTEPIRIAPGEVGES